MNKLNRRQFLRLTTASLAALTLPRTTWSRVLGANDEIRVAVVGFHGQGKTHINSFGKIKGVRIVALCDVDSEVLNAEAEKFKSRNEIVQTFTDVRRLLERKDIDAISIATPNHWHSLMTIWACQAGKDVYVEKPVSHNVWEGRQAVNASRKYNRIVQAGTQARSSSAIREAMDLLHRGEFGKIKLVRGLCYKRRASIGKTTGQQPIPAYIDYDLWTGPAQLVGLMRKNLHYDWHWVWNTGNGDIGNQGIHQMDLARWALNANHIATNVFSLGGRFGYIDDGETPNTQIASYEFPEGRIIFEVRGLPASKDSNTMDKYLGIDIGVVVHCEHGTLAFPSNYSNVLLYDDKNNLVKTFTGGGNHYENFIEAVRSRDRSKQTADILEGHLSSALCHLGNISYRLGTNKSPEEIREILQSDNDAMEACERAYEHLVANEVDLEQYRPIMGLFLKLNPKSEKFTNNKEANKYLTRQYRAPFVVPKRV